MYRECDSVVSINSNSKHVELLIFSRSTTQGIIGQKDVYPKYGQFPGAWDSGGNKAAGDVYIEVWITCRKSKKKVILDR